jgi:hypothetical protein
MSFRNIVSLVAGVILCGICVSCIGREPPSITSNDADCLIPAIKAGVAANDRHIIPYLVNDLSSDDGAIRLYAIEGLHRMTGQDMGFVYYADDDDRKPAFERWQKWLSEQTK